MNYIKILTVAVLACFLAGCEDENYSLEETERTPDFNLVPLESNPNKVVYTDHTEDVLSRSWDFGKNELGDNATPPFANNASDTVLFVSKGMYTVTLHTVLEGIGPVSASQTITIEEDAVPECDEVIGALTDDCTTKCWRLVDEDGSIRVGPVPLSGEWFTGGLDPAQADDIWCLNAEDFTFVYENAGATFSSCQGFIVDENYPIPDDATFQFLPGGGIDGFDRITLSDGSWMGVEDSGPNYDIFEITEDEMLVVTTITPCDGSPSPGYFTLKFTAAE